MRATIHHSHSPDIWRLDEFRPASRAASGALIEMIMGPEDGPGEESLQVVMGTPEYLVTVPPTPYAIAVDEREFDTCGDA